MAIWRNAEGRVRSGWVIATFVVIAGGAGFVAQLATFLLGLNGSVQIEPKLFFATVPSLLAGGTATAICWLLFKEDPALSRVDAGKHFARGFGLAALTLTIACVVPALIGVQSLALQPSIEIIPAFFALAPAGIGEELLLRGLAFQALRRGLGDWPAIIGSSVLFGVMHLLNPHASLVAAAIITLVGLWFGLAMVRTGSLWMPIGLHLGWNFFEGCVFGQPVSGLAPGPTIFTANWPSKTGFWSGADFGPEAAGWTAVLLVGWVVFSATRSRVTSSARSEETSAVQ